MAVPEQITAATLLALPELPSEFGVALSHHPGPVWVLHQRGCPSAGCTNLWPVTGPYASLPRRHSATVELCWCIVGETDFVPEDRPWAAHDTIRIRPWRDLLAVAARLDKAERRLRKIERVLRLGIFGRSSTLDRCFSDVMTVAAEFQEGALTQAVAATGATDARYDRTTLQAGHETLTTKLAAVTDRYRKVQDRWPHTRLWSLVGMVAVPSGSQYLAVLDRRMLDHILSQKDGYENRLTAVTLMLADPVAVLDHPGGDHRSLVAFLVPGRFVALTRTWFAWWAQVHQTPSPDEVDMALRILQARGERSGPEAELRDALAAATAALAA